MSGYLATAHGPVASISAALVVLALAASARPRAIAGERRPASPRPSRRTPMRRASSIRAARRASPVVAAAVLGLATGWTLSIAVVATVMAVRVARPILAERQRQRSAHRDFPDAVDRIVLLVHAGLTPHLAVREAARSSPPSIGPAFDEVGHRLDRGLPLGEALIALPDLLGPRAATLADAFAAADRYGLPLGPMLDQLAGDARAERRRLDEADARRLPVRMTFPLVACTLPAFVLVAIAPAVIAALSSLGGTW